MKFKIGDKVRVTERERIYQNIVGFVGTVVKLSHLPSYPYGVKFDREIYGFGRENSILPNPKAKMGAFNDEELELVEPKESHLPEWF